MTDNKNFYQKIAKDYSGAIDRIERLSEIIFGVIMTLTFTGTISVAEGGMQEVRLTLWAALGCNTAWGIIDGLFYLMNTLYDRGKSLRVFRELKKSGTDEERDHIILDNITPVLAEVMTETQIGEIRKELLQLPEPPKRAFLIPRDFANALYIFVIVFLSTFPMALPLFFISDPLTALRTSNAIGLVIMFVAGYIIGKKTGYNQWFVGFLFALLGAALVAMTIALGG